VVEGAGVTEAEVQAYYARTGLQARGASLNGFGTPDLVQEPEKPVQVELRHVFTTNIEPMGAPRQVRSDKWNPRRPVLKYRAWKDELRKQIPIVPSDPVAVEILAIFSMPKSWSKKKRSEMILKPHRSKPDADNVVKAVCDTLYVEDSIIADMSIRKRWASKPGLQITILEYSKEKRTL
jgi:Holliday junction resolvase RusA-like endonuclease